MVEGRWLEAVSVSPSRQEIADALGDRLAPLRGEALLLLGDVHHRPGDLVQCLLRVREPTAPEGVTSTQPDVTVLQWQEGDKEVDQVFLHKAAVAKATV